MRLSWFREEYLQNHSLMWGSLAFIIMVGVVLVSPIFITTSPIDMDYTNILQRPGGEVVFGTDDLGRDIFVRVIYGAHTSLSIGLMVMITTTIFGTLIGLFSGYYDRVDQVAMRLMDIQMSFPALLLAIAILAILGNNPYGVVIALSIVYGPRTARVVRSVVLTTREEDYIMAAVAAGGNSWRILFMHVLPAVIPALVVQETFLFAYAILGEAGLSFVGVGVQPPSPSWGNIMGDARAMIREAPWILFFPGLAIMMAVISLNLMGDGLREALDPRRVRTAGEEAQPSGV